MIVNFLFLFTLITGCIALVGPKKEESLSSRLPGFVETKIKNPISFYLSKIKRSMKKDAYDEELFRALLYVKNISILGSSSSISTQLLLEELSEISDNLKKVFLDMAHYLTVNDKEKASRLLGDVVGSDIARDVGRFLAGWEELSPNDILETIETYQNILYQARITKQKRKDEAISDIIYFPVVLNCMLVLLNFIYIAYFMEQKLSMGLLF